MDCPSSTSRAAVCWNSVISQFYGWITASLALTGAIAALTLGSQATFDVIHGKVVVNWGLLLLELIGVFVLSSTIYLRVGGGPFNAFDIPSLPVAVTVFPGEIHRAPRSWGERAFGNLIYWNEVDRGGHFPAWEQPELFSSEIRAAFRSLR